jgi:hypothetical protein
LPHELHATLPGDDAAGGADIGIPTAATVEAWPSTDAGAAAGAGFAASDVPHILQKFMPGGLTAWQELQVTPPAGAAGLAAAAASSRCPQS